MKALLVGDLHITLHKHKARKVDVEEMFVAKFEALQKVVNEKHVDFVICAGDVFDKHQPTLNEFFFARRLFDLLSVTTYAIPGNHDMLAGNIDSINTSGVVRLSSICSKFDVLASLTRVKDTAIIEHLYNAKLDVSNVNFSKVQGPAIIVTHNSIAPKGHIPNMPFNVTTDDVVVNKNVLVFAGHIHKPFETRNVLNVGSFYRKTIAEQHKLQVAIFDFDTTSYRLVNLQEYLPDTYLPENIFDLTLAPKKDSVEYMEAFTELAEQFENDVDKITKYINAAFNLVEKAEDTVKERVFNYLKGGN